MFLTQTVCVRDLFERRIWGKPQQSGAEGTVMRRCWSVARRVGKLWQPSLSLLCFTSSRCLCIQPTQPAVSWGRVCACVFVRLAVCMCVSVQGPGMPRWLNPRLSEKHARLPNTNDPEYTYGCFGENKWAENGIHKHSWYRDGGRGGREGQRSDAFSQIPLSHGGRFFFFIVFASISVCCNEYLCASVWRYLPAISELL